jgi:hypothetical protein
VSHAAPVERASLADADDVTIHGAPDAGCAMGADVFEPGENHGVVRPQYLDQRALSDACRSDKKDASSLDE